MASDYLENSFGISSTQSIFAILVLTATNHTQTRYNCIWPVLNKGYIILTVLAGYSPPFYIHPIFIGIVGILILQILFKNRFLGLISRILFFLVNLYFLGALLTEFYEFTEFNNSAKQLLFVGLTIWAVNFTASLTMSYKYATNNFTSNSKIKLEKQNI